MILVLVWNLNLVLVQGVDPESISFLPILVNLQKLNLGQHHRTIVSSITDECLIQLNPLERLNSINLSQCVHVTDAGEWVIIW